MAAARAFVLLLLSQMLVHVLHWLQNVLLSLADMRQILFRPTKSRRVVGPWHVSLSILEHRKKGLAPPKGHMHRLSLSEGAKSCGLEGVGCASDKRTTWDFNYDSQVHTRLPSPSSSPSSPNPATSSEICPDATSTSCAPPPRAGPDFLIPFAQAVVVVLFLAYVNLCIGQGHSSRIQEAARKVAECLAGNKIWSEHGVLYVSAIVTPLGGQDGGRLMFDTSPHITPDGSLQARLEARLVKTTEGGKDCIILPPYFKRAGLTLSGLPEHTHTTIEWDYVACGGIILELKCSTLYYPVSSAKDCLTLVFTHGIAGREFFSQPTRSMYTPMASVVVKFGVSTGHHSAGMCFWDMLYTVRYILLRSGLPYHLLPQSCIPPKHCIVRRTPLDITCALLCTCLSHIKPWLTFAMWGKKYGEYFLFGQYHPFQSYVCSVYLPRQSTITLCSHFRPPDPGDMGDLHLPQLTSEGPGFGPGWVHGLGLDFASSPWLHADGLKWILIARTQPIGSHRVIEVRKSRAKTCCMGWDAPLKHYTMVRRGPKSWTTIEEDVFLRALLPEYNSCRHRKLYGNFWIDTFHQFFNLWPESTRLHQNIDSGIPAEGDLTPDQKKIVGLAIIKRKEIIKRWFRWQMSTACLARSGNSRSVLNLDDTFGGGGVSSWKLNNDVKIRSNGSHRAFNELGSHLDHVFRHLSHKMGGLKFTCIAGGRNPSTGEVVVVDFHLGETDTGAEFSSCYSGFSDVQVAYADFVKEAVAHDDKMRSLASEEALAQALTVSKDVDKQIYEDEDMNIGDEQTYEDEDGNIGDDYIPQELPPIQDFPAGLQGVPHIDLDTGTPATAGEWSDINQLHTKGHPLLLEELDTLLLRMDEITNTLSVPNVTDYGGDAYFSPPFDITNEYPAAASAPGNLLPVQGLDLYDLDYLLRDLDFLYNNEALPEATVLPIFPSPAVHNELPHLSAVHNELPRLPAFYDELSRLPAEMQSATPWLQPPTPPMLPPSLPHGTAGGTTTGTATDTSADLDPLTAEQPKGPRRTTRRHVPSKHEQALNIIGSSNARIHAAVGGTEGKENDESTFLPTKRKVKPTNQQASNGEALFSDGGPHTPSISLDTHHGDSLRISSNTHPRLSLQLYTTLVCLYFIQIPISAEDSLVIV
ncbi:hypothetical protein DFH29DRAFT_877738 [Suillus ampliporus]|nr:hypothetical protein DFH29DRAFT_877738 [Suillus ampliporus]